MKGVLIFLAYSVVSIGITFAQQEITIAPYLQDAQPNSIIVKWETNGGEESVVEWGLTNKLGKKSKGRTEVINYSTKRLHTVKIYSLKRFTTYYYRVKTGKNRSDIFQFKTPPFASDNESFNLVAMSDMQYDYNLPNKFGEIVEDGLLKYLKNEHGGKLSDNLALVMIPGDLVKDGDQFYQWKEHFFNPAEKLFTEVPVYPVLGNHEKNSGFYFQYFNLPENGTPAYNEHWWYKDYGNVRIIGLNSNEGYNNSKQQIDWLKKVLSETEKNDDIDFVFAQMHHPHKSELWIPGERKSSGQVVKLLEEFSTKSDKPSLHFFGHTHGYSRGQSKQHKHLWINVASAGGAIDNWGEFEGRDYDEFTVTQDEYGFVMVEVDGDPNNPKFTIKRISRGNEETLRNNELRDSITVFKKTHKPDTPRATEPLANAKTDAFGVELKASNFKSTYKEAYHDASHWQVATSKEFKEQVFESWKQKHNWYFKEDRQRGDDLTNEKTKRLKPNTVYYWRVRYRDQNLNWSEWSQPTSFKTK